MKHSSIKNQVFKDKKRELLSLSDTAKGMVIYSPDDDSIGEVKEMFYQCYKKNAKFFEREIDKVVLILLYDRQEMDEVAGYKTQNWVVGYANSLMENQIFVFSPQIFEILSNHSIDSLKSTITHEIAHLFTRSIHKGYKPLWLNEGLACIVADQINQNGNQNIVFNPKIVSLLSTPKQWRKNAAKKSLMGYWQSWKAVNYLIEKYGKQKLFYFLASLGDGCNNVIFCKKFKQIYNKDILEVMKQIN